MSSVMDPGSCAPSTSTTAGIIVQPNGHAYVGTMNLNFYEAPMSQMPLPTSIECNIQDPNIPYVGREDMLNLLHNAVGDGEYIDEATVPIPGVIMSESKKIGCWTARTWTPVVTSLSIVFSVIGVPIILDQQMLPRFEMDMIALLLALVDFFMAFLLLFGAELRSSCAVLLWLCYACVATLLYAGVFILGGGTTPYIIGAVLMFVCVRSILIFIVRIHWKEIRGSSVQNDATRHQDGV